MNPHLQLAHAYGIKLALEQRGYRSVEEFEKEAAGVLNKNTLAHVLAWLASQGLMTTPASGLRVMPDLPIQQMLKVTKTKSLPTPPKPLVPPLKTAGVLDTLRGIANRPTSLGMSVGDILSHMGQGAAGSVLPAVLPAAQNLAAPAFNTPLARAAATPTSLGVPMAEALGRLGADVAHHFNPALGQKAHSGVSTASKVLSALKR